MKKSGRGGAPEARLCSGIHAKLGGLDFACRQLGTTEGAVCVFFFLTVINTLGVHLIPSYINGFFHHSPDAFSM